MPPTGSADPSLLDRAVAHLRAGGLVAFPTETVYGLGADAANPAAVERVFAVKGRPDENPLPLVVSGAVLARPLVRGWPEEAERLAAAFWPGPLSIVLPKSGAVPVRVTAGRGTVSLRCPDHPLTLALLGAFGAPLVGPSANPSGQSPPTSASEVLGYFPPDSGVMVLDGGACRVGTASTVVELSPDAGVIVHRVGTVSEAEVRREIRA
jgi:L-threonylcarbamoyladenylate synthase